MVLSQAATTGHSSEETGQSKQVNKQISKHLKERMKESNDVYIWGSNAWFQLGLGRDDARPAPSLVNRLLGKAVKQVVCGLQHTVAVTGMHKLAQAIVLACFVSYRKLTRASPHRS